MPYLRALAVGVLAAVIVAGVSLAAGWAIVLSESDALAGPFLLGVLVALLLAGSAAGRLVSTPGPPRRPAVEALLASPGTYLGSYVLLTVFRSPILRNAPTRIVLIGVLLLVVGMIVAPWLATYAAFRRAKYRVGHCRKCGYNLTGNVSGTCPECGTAILSKT